MDMEFDTYLYFVRVYEDGEIYEYEYGNLNHAMQQFQWETNTRLIKYRNGEEFIIEEKGAAN